MNLSDIITDFEQTRNDVSDMPDPSTGGRYAREIVGRRDDSGEILWQSRANVKPFALWLKNDRGKSVWDASGGDLRDHLEAMKEADYAGKTKVLRLSAISKFYQHLHQMDRDDELPQDPPPNPAEKLTSDDKAERGVTQTETKGEDKIAPKPDEIRRMCNNIPQKKPASIRTELLIKFMAYCGLRRGEAAILKVDHIDRERGVVTVPPVKSPDERTVPWPEGEGINLLLSQWLDGGLRDAIEASYDGESDYLFPTHESEHISGYTINRLVKEAAEAAGIQDDGINQYAAEDSTYGREAGRMSKIHAHSLRHSYGVQSIRSGIDITELRDLMGHYSIEVTEKYIGWDEEEQIEAGRQFDPYAER